MDDDIPGTNLPPTDDSGAGGTVTQPKLDDLYKQALRDNETSQRRFAGLQAKYQQEREKWTADSAKLIDLEEKLTALTGEHETKALGLTKAESERDVAMGEVELLKGQLERLTIVTTEFPHLVGFLKDELLPDAAGDDLREKLKVLSGKIEQIKTGKIDEDMAGSSPPDTPAADADNASTAMQKAIDALQKGDVAAYDKHYGDYLNLSKK